VRFNAFWRPAITRQFNRVATKWRPWLTLWTRTTPSLRWTSPLSSIINVHQHTALVTNSIIFTFNTSNTT